MANRWGNNGNSDRLFSWAPKSLQMVTAAMKLKDAYSLGKKAVTNLDSALESRDITLLSILRASVAHLENGNQDAYQGSVSIYTD